MLLKISDTAVIETMDIIAICIEASRDIFTWVFTLTGNIEILSENFSSINEATKWLDKKLKEIKKGE